MGHFFPDLFAFGLAVVIHWGAYVSGGAPWAADEFVKRVSDTYKKWAENHTRLRRRLEVGALLLGLLFAGFEAWKDQNAERITAENELAAKGTAFSTEKQRGDELDAAINGRDGYKDQITKLRTDLAIARSAPAKTIIQQVPVVIPSGGQQLSPEQLAKVKKLRLELSSFLADGVRLRDQAATPTANDPTKEANDWAANVEQFLHANLDDSYVERFRDATELLPRSVPGLSDQRENLWWAIYVRTSRLNQFVAELSK